MSWTVLGHLQDTLIFLCQRFSPEICHELSTRRAGTALVDCAVPHPRWFWPLETEPKQSGESSRKAGGRTLHSWFWVTVQLPAGVGWTDSLVEVRNTSVGGIRIHLGFGWEWDWGKQADRGEGPIFGGSEDFFQFQTILSSFLGNYNPSALFRRWRSDLRNNWIFKALLLLVWLENTH